MMTRRNFLFLGSSLLFGGCRFEYNPYSANPSKRELNSKNIAAISSKSSGTVQSFKVAVVSDSHTYYSDFEDVIKNIKKRGEADFIIHCGDFTDSGIVKEFEWGEEILSKASIPYVALVGNHDALANGRGIYLEMFGYFNFSFSYNKVYFIAFNNNSWEFGSDIPDFEWLENELANMPLEAIKVVACHVPPFDSARFNSKEQKRFHTIMQQYGVSTVINGHKHNHVIRNRDGIEYITVGSVSKRNYVTLDIDATQVMMEKIDV